MSRLSWCSCAVMLLCLPQATHARLSGRKSALFRNATSSAAIGAAAAAEAALEHDGTGAPSRHPAQHATPAPRFTWLAATSFPCKERAAVAEVSYLIRLFASHTFHVFANAFDVRAEERLESQAGPSACLAALHALDREHVHTSTVPGHKTVFWKRVLTPAVTSTFDVIWLLDCDVRVSPRLFSTDEVSGQRACAPLSLSRPSTPSPAS